MTVELAPEDQTLIDELIAQGRFRSVSEAIHAGLTAIHENDAETEDWKTHARSRIQAGMNDLEQGRLIPGDQVLALLRENRRKTA